MNSLIETKREVLEKIRVVYDSSETLKSYASRAAEIEATAALDILSDIYIDNCGISLGTRTVAENAAFYWIHRWQEENIELNKRMGLYDVMALRSERYRQNKEQIDRYDVTILQDSDLYQICMSMVEETQDETTRIALCAGVLYVLGICD